MRIPRLYLPVSNLHIDQEIELDKQSSHYISNVLRRKSGQEIKVFNGSHYEYDAKIINLTRNAATILLFGEQQRDRESTLSITLALSISKNQHMDIALQKAVETGVKVIQPIVSQYSSIKLEKDRLPNKVEHWQKLIISACEQSGRTCLPELKSPILANEYLKQTSDNTRLMLLPESTKRFKEIVLKEKHIELLIGPEGGFTKEEEQLAQEQGFNAVKLGPRILRTETAVTSAISVCQNLWGDY